MRCCTSKANLTCPFQNISHRGEFPMNFLGRIYLHLISLGSLLYIFGKIGGAANLQFKKIADTGMTIGLAAVAAGCVLGFFFCQGKEEALASGPPEPGSKRALSECRTQKLGLLYAFLGLLFMSFSPLLPPDYSSIFAPAGAFCGLMAISFLFASMFYSRKIGI